MSTDPATLEDFQRLSDMFHDGRPTGTATKTPHNAVVLHVFEDDVPFDHWLVTQYPRLKMVLSSACRLSAMAPLSTKGLTPLHYGVLVGMSPEELTALRGKWPWSLMAPGPGVPTALQLAIALGRPELTNCLVRRTPVLAPQPRCELETLYPASEMDVYALALGRLREEEDGALKKAYRDAATEIESAQCADLREPLDSAHSRRHNLLSVLPYVLLFVLLGCAHPFFFRFPVDEAILDAKEAAIQDCNGDGFACARALKSGVMEPVTMCGNSSEQRPCLFQTYVTKTALLSAADPYGSGRRYRVLPRSPPRSRADIWEFWTWESDADWKCRFDTVALQRPPPNSPVTYMHRVVCTGPVEFTLAVFFLIVVCTVGVFTSLLRDLWTWHRGHLCLVWRDRLRLWMGVTSDLIICIAGGFLAYSLRPRGAFPDVSSVELGRLATAAAVLCVPKCSYLLPSGNNTSAAHAVWTLAGVASGVSGVGFVVSREPIALLFFVFLAVVYALVLCEDRRPDPAVWHEHRVAYLEEAHSGHPARSVVDCKLVRWGCYCMVTLCLAALALDMCATSGHQRSPDCEWGSGCSIRRPDMALYPQRKIQFVKPSVEQAPP